MDKRTKPLAEELVIATFFKVGRKVRLLDDDRLTRIFDNAANSVESPFSAFRMHPVYKDSRLGSVLQDLDLGGLIVRENKPLRYFRPTSHAVGRYGRSLYDSLDEKTKKLVDRLADEIKHAYA